MQSEINLTHTLFWQFKSSHEAQELEAAVVQFFFAISYYESFI